MNRLARHLTFSLFVLLITLVSFLAGSVSWAGDGTGLSFAFSTRNPNTNRYEGITLVDAGEMNWQGFQDLVDNATPSSILPSSDQPVEVIVVMPRIPQDASDDVKQAFAIYKKEFIDKTKQTLDRRYQQTQYKIRESYVDINAEATELLRLKYQTAEMLEHNPQLNETEKDLLAQVDAEATEGLKERQNFCVSWLREKCSQVYKNFKAEWITDRHPYDMEIAARVISLTKVGIAFTVILSKYGLSPMSVLIAALQSTVSGLTAYYSDTISHFTTSYRWPWKTESRFVRWFNSQSGLKSISFNVLRSAFMATLLRQLAYAKDLAVNGEPVESVVSTTFMKQLLMLVIPEGLFDAAGDYGLRQLELKGRINSQDRKTIIWAISVLETAMKASFVGGDFTASMGWAAPAWALKLGVFMSSKALKARADRLIVMSDLISENTDGVELPGGLSHAIQNMLGSGLVNASLNRAQNQFHVTDRTLLNQDMGLRLAWGLGLDTVGFARIQDDPTLERSDFIKIMNLQDTEYDLVERLWEYRNNRLGQNYSSLDLCTAAFL